MANTFNRGDVVETPVGNGVVQRKRQHFEQYEVLLDAPVIEKFLHESDYRYPNDKSQPRVVGWAEGNQGAFHPSLLKKVGKTYTPGSACIIVALDWDGVNIPYRGNVIANEDGTFFKHGSRELWVRAGYSQSATVHWPGAKARALQLIESAIHLRDAGVWSAGSAILDELQHLVTLLNE